MGLDVSPSLCLEGDREHLPGRQATQFVEVERSRLRREAGIGVVDYPEHGVFLLPG